MTLGRAGRARVERAVDHRRHRQRRQDRHQGGAAVGARPERHRACLLEILQQPLGRAADARQYAARGRFRRVRDRHEPRRRDRRPDPSRPPAYRHRHHGGAGASRLLPFRRGYRRRQGGDLSTAWSRAARRSSIATILISSGSRPMPANMARRLSASARPKAPRPGCCRPSWAPTAPPCRPIFWARSSTTASARRDAIWCMNSLAVLAAVKVAGADLKARRGRARRYTGPGRAGPASGDRDQRRPVAVVDESYNANPASMRAALATLGLTPRERVFPPRGGARRHAGTRLRRSEATPGACGCR